MLQTRIFVLEFLAEKEQMYPQKKLCGNWGILEKLNYE